MEVVEHGTRQPKVVGVGEGRAERIDEGQISGVHDMQSKRGAKRVNIFRSRVIVVGMGARNQVPIVRFGRGVGVRCAIRRSVEGY